MTGLTDAQTTSGRTDPPPPSSGRRHPGRLPLGYQPALDGIRAVAVIAVIVFHGGVSWLPGGFLGVDLFFVLSGFLITTVLLEEWGVKGRIDLGEFWIRRARRLLPALVLVLVAVAVYGATAAPLATRASLSKDGVASLFYVANWRFVLGHQSYFAGFAAPSPLRHLWSLAVEEQWYIVWPPVLALLVGGLRRRWSPSRTLELLLAVLGVLTVASVAQMVRLDVVTHGAADANRSYYGTDTHIQVLLVGAMLAVARLRWPPDRAGRQRGVRLVGMLGAVGCVVMFAQVAGSDRWLYRGGFALFALCGAALVSATVTPTAGVLSRVLGVAPLRAIGRVSYGLYLWHWPVDIYLNPTRVHLGELALLLVRTTVTTVFTVASYHLVEMPIRSGRMLPRGALPARVGAVGVVSVALTVLAVTVVPSIGAASPNVAVQAQSAPTATHSAPAPAPVVSSPPTTAVASTFIPAVAPGAALKVLVVGDSVGQSLTRGVTPPPPLQFSNESLEGCGVTFGAAIAGGYPIYNVSQCPQAQQQAKWSAGLAAQPDVVVMSFGTWEVFDQEFNSHAYRVFAADYAQLISDQLQADIDFIAQQANAHIVLLDVPCYHEANYSLGGGTSPRNDPSRVAWVNTIFAQVANQNPGRVTLLPISQWACPGGTFLARSDGVTLRPDGVHYDAQSAALAWKWLAPQIEALTATATPVPVTTH